MNKKKNEVANGIEHRKSFQSHTGVVHTCGFLSQDYLLSGSNDTKIIVWELEQARPVTKYDDHITPVSCIDVNSMDGNIFASGSEDCFKIWDIRMSKPCFRMFDTYN